MCLQICMCTQTCIHTRIYKCTHTHSAGSFTRIHTHTRSAESFTVIHTRTRSARSFTLTADFGPSSYISVRHPSIPDTRPTLCSRHPATPCP